MDHDYYFNEWAFLAQADPEAFERRRREYIEQFLSTTGHRRRYLEALQGTIDAERELAGRPSESMRVLCRMMCHSLAELQAALTSLSSELKALPALKEMQVPAPTTAAIEPPAARPPLVLLRRSARRTPHRRLSL